MAETKQAASRQQTKSDTADADWLAGTSVTRTPILPRAYYQMHCVHLITRTRNVFLTFTRL